MSHDGSHDECGKTVYRPHSSCISSVEFFLSTWIRSKTKLSQLSLYTISEGTVLSLGIAFKTWPCNWVVLCSVLVLFLVETLH